MKYIVEVEKESTEVKLDMTVTNEGFENDWWKIILEGDEFSVHGKDLEELFRAFLANR